MDKKEIILQLGYLEDEYKEASEERKKEIDQQIKKYGEMLQQLGMKKQEEINRLLDKAHQMTYADVQKLRRYGITKSEILSKLGVPKNSWKNIDIDDRESFYRGLEFLEIEEEEDEMTRAKGDIEKAKQLLRETNLSVQEIARKTGANENTVYYHAKKIREENNKNYADIIRQRDEHIFSLQTQLDKAEREKQQLQQAINELREKLNENNRIELWKEKYMQERQAHETLLKYISITNGVVQ